MKSAPQVTPSSELSDGLETSSFDVPRLSVFDIGGGESGGLFSLDGDTTGAF